MPSIVTLERTKQHLRVDGTAEDALITDYINAAESYVLDYLEQAAWPLASFSPPASPEAVKQAVLLMVGDFYENREADIKGTSYTMRPTVAHLLQPYRNVSKMGI